MHKRANSICVSRNLTGKTRRYHTVSSNTVHRTKTSCLRVPWWRCLLHVYSAAALTLVAAASASVTASAAAAAAADVAVVVAAAFMRLV